MEKKGWSPRVIDGGKAKTDKVDTDLSAEQRLLLKVRDVQIDDQLVELLKMLQSDDLD